MTFAIPETVAGAWLGGSGKDLNEVRDAWQAEALLWSLGERESSARRQTESMSLAGTLLRLFPSLGLEGTGLAKAGRVLVALESDVFQNSDLEIDDSNVLNVTGRLSRIYGEVGADRLVVAVDRHDFRGFLLVDSISAHLGAAAPLAGLGRMQLFDGITVDNAPCELVEEPDAVDLAVILSMLNASEAIGLAMRAVDISRAGEIAWEAIESQRLQFMISTAAMQMAAARASLSVAAGRTAHRAFPVLAASSSLSCLQAAQSVLHSIDEVSRRTGTENPASDLESRLRWLATAPWTELEMREAVGRQVASGFADWDVMQPESDAQTSRPMEFPTEVLDLRDLVRSFVERRLVPLEAQLESDNHLDADTWQRIESEARGLGLTALGVPVELGGAGLELSEQVVVAEEMGHVSVGFRHVIGSPPGAQVLARYGTDDQHERYLRPWLAGESWGAWAATEPNAGSDLGSMATKATRVDHGWVLDGSKHFITGADRANFFIIFARTTPDVGVRGLTAFLVDKSSDGLHVGREQKMMGRGGLHSYELHLDSVAVRDEQRLGGVDEGFKVLIGNVNELRVLVSAHCVGVADRLLRIGQEWAQNRHQFGQPIIQFGALQGYLGDSLIEYLECRGALYQAAWAIENKDDSRNETAAVKAMCTEMVGRVADSVMQVLGGYGYCRDLPVEALFRAVRLWRIAEGSSEIQRMLLWRGIIGGWWPDLVGLGMLGGDSE